MAEMTAPASPLCPWCSKPLPSPDTATCPSCGATVQGDADAQLPGVTAIDAEAIVRAARAPVPVRRSRLLSWISGEYEVEDASVVATPGSLGPPPPEVAREMLRLELEAEVANLQAEADSMRSEAEVDARVDGDAAAEPDEATATASADGADRAASEDTPQADSTAP